MDEKLLSPGELAAVKGSPFLLSTAEWLRVQRYVTNAMALPATEPLMRTALQMPDSMKIDEFKPLLEGYKTVVPHVTKWKTTTFPATVSLAGDIVKYNSMAKGYYNALKEPINALLKDPKDEAAKRGLSGAIKLLSQAAADRAGKAKKVYADIQEFSLQTATDAVLIGDLNTTYQKKFGANSEWGKKLAKDLSDTRDLIEAAITEYEYDKAVACATPSYAWIIVPPIGLIAAIIVAGIYGDKAVKAKARLEELRKDLKKAKEDELLSLSLTCMLSVARDSLANIQRDIQAALPVIQKIQGVWHAIHTDLESLVELITENIDDAIMEIKKIGIDIALEQWSELAVKAEAYRANAYIEVDPGKEG
ncbi:alpha-xenorhabdolysin family binary toxin subunit A [Variovorax sp. J22R115]|uniref:alpha-xenorhabdolysin family binary toxin subunit A n=1 Tax=Variovorax sp. J22R115 TaxID=3053509 RepID=UPI002575A960|nr:alpha-xenorhabdolysin family binary toxin subunit A [Variovorax sp. J22R115]MDM0053019.1 alpha-xenorhabdolysin family binary toxin subunit A [Variovorax sp. J22R115]